MLDTWPLFIRKMRVLTPQSSGARIQNYIAAAFGWRVVSQKLDLGDIVDASGRYFEVKASIITPSNPDVNLVQIRPYQKIDGYHIFVVDSDYKLHHLSLTKAQMAAEIAVLGNNAHGTNDANKKNVNQEKAIRFAWTPQSGTAKTWLEKYRAPMPANENPLRAHIGERPTPESQPQD